MRFFNTIKVYTCYRKFPPVGGGWKGADSMGHYHWLSHEVSRWIQETIISREEGQKILSLYKKEDHLSFSGEAFFVLAFICLVAGAAFAGAGFWNELTQDERFMLALVPLVISLLMEAAVLIFDRKMPDEPVLKEGPHTVHLQPNSFDYGTISDSSLGDEMSAALGAKAESLAKASMEAAPVSSGTYHHRVPVAVREAVGTFHGIMLLGALWMVNDSFWLSPDLYPLALAAAVFLLIMMYVSRSAGLGIVYMVSCVGLYALSPVRGWQDGASWTGMILAIPFLASMLVERRQKAVVFFSWIWALGVLFLIFRSTENLLWQTMFFSLAAALTWMAGGVLRSYGAGALALRFFGGIAVVAALLEGSLGHVWQGAFGGWLLWLLFLVFLALDAVLLIRMGFKKEWLSILAGLTPFIMMGAALISLFDASGGTSATLVSLYSVVLALGIIGRGYQTGRVYERWCGIALLFAAGIMRIVDSTLTFGQRGLFFLCIGLLATAACVLISLPGLVKRQRRKRRRLKKKQQEEMQEEDTLPSPENDTKGGESHD